MTYLKLRRYRESRAKGIADADDSTMSFDRQISGENDYEAPSFFDAVADGSQIVSYDAFPFLILVIMVYF